MRLSAGAAFAPLILAFILILPGSAARAQVYRWTDAQGVTHFTDRAENVPPGSTESVEQTQPQEKQAAVPPAPPGETKPERESEKPEVPSEARADSDNEAAPAVQPPAMPDVALDHFGRDETWWRDRRKFWEQRLSDAQRLHDEARREFSRANQRYDSREYKQMKLLRERMEALEKEIAGAQEMLGGGLAREARKAGAPPGWVR